MNSIPEFSDHLSLDCIRKHIYKSYPNHRVKIYIQNLPEGKKYYTQNPNELKNLLKHTNYTYPKVKDSNLKTELCEDYCVRLQKKTLKIKMIFAKL